MFEALLGEGRRALEAGEPGHAAESLDQALALWRGPPLAEVAFEDFAQPEIRRLDELHLEALEARIEARLQLGRHQELIGELESLLAEHPSRERLAAQLMLALYRCGRQVDALEVFQRTRVRLAEELGLEPGPALKEMQAQVLEQAQPLDTSLGDVFGLSVPDVPRPATVPSLPTPTIGRQQEIDAIRGLLARDEVRLVTVVGTGGVGKTRVALEVARSLEHVFADGVCWVELAGIATPADVAPSIVRALDLAPMPGEASRDALCRFLARRHLLLVLDNFEHVLEAAALVSELLAAGSDLTVLATSREALDIAAEQRFGIPPLAVPQGSDDVSLDEVKCSEASELFVAAARRRDMQFELTADAAPAVAKITRLLDGLPLALELAAARTGMSTVEELAAQLEEAAVDLSGGPRDAPSRHKTLRNTIGWSYRLLDQPQANAFVQFGVFAGGATVDAAMAVTTAPAEVLQALVAKSLIERRKRPDGSARFVMLETIREYALELLSGGSQRAAVRRRHIEYYLGVVERAVRHLSMHGESVAMATIDSEIDNLEAALQWALEHVPKSAPRLSGALGDYWWVRGDAEGLSWLDAAIRAAGEDAPARDRARAQLARAHQLGLRRGVAYEETARAALELFRELGDHAGMSDAYVAIHRAHTIQGRHGEEYRELVEAARRHARVAGDDVRLGNASTRLLYAVAPEERPAVLAEVTELLVRTGNYRGLASVHNDAGWRALKAGRAQEALELLRTGLSAADAVGATLNTMQINGNIGLASLFVGNFDAARTAFARQLTLCRGHAFPRGADEGLAGIAALCCRDGRYEAAARLLGAAHTLGYPEPDDKEVVEHLEREYFTPARKRYGAEAWRLDEERGGALSYDAAITNARKQAERTDHCSPRRVRRAFMFTDIVDSTPLVSVLTDDAWAQLLQWHDRTLRALFRQHHGEEVSHAGDGFFVAFDRADAAVRCAREIQRQLERHRRENGFAPQVRIGIHLDDANYLAGDYHGLGVHVAARIGPQAQGGEVLVSRQMLEALGPAISVGAPRAAQLKGVNDAVELVPVIWA